MQKKTVEKITTTYILSKFMDDKSGYCIYLYKDESTGNTVTCTGNFLPSTPKIRYCMQGQWKDAGKFGKNFVVDHYSEIIEATKESIVTYLSSGIISGIGKATAEKIYLRFKADSLKVIEESPEKLLSINGISTRKLEKIKTSYKEKRLYRNVVEFLLPYGVTPKQTVKVMNELNIHSITEIKANPYRLHNVHGISIQCVDMIAKTVEFPMGSMERLRAHATYVLLQNEKSGHTAMEANHFGRELIRSLHSNAFHYGNICDYTIQLLKEGYIKHCKIQLQGKEITMIARSKTYLAETNIAKAVYQLDHTQQPSHKNPMAWIQKNCQKDGILLDSYQMDAVLTIIKNSFVIVTGRPGTGKTTIIKQTAEFLQANESDREIYFMAPSGRAARRIKESTNFNGRTIHASLGLLVSDDHTMSENEIVSIENATIFCDEVSMVGVFLMAIMTERIKPGCRLVLIGDENQLPSVECGSVLRDLIASKMIPVIKLSKVHRQAEKSNIYINSKKIESGQADLSEGADFQIIKADSSLEAQKLIVEHFVDYVYKYGIQNIYCIVPRKEGYAGVKSLNAALQERINPPVDGILEFKAKGMILRIGDPVMHLKNTDEVANGDIGYVSRIYTSIDEGSIVEITYFGDTVIKYSTDQADEITLAYAFTVHKAQGSENKVVLTYLSKECGKNMLKRNLLYTAISRGKILDELYLLNDSALSIAVATDDRAFRLTTLSFHLTRVYGGWLPLQ